MKLHLPLPLFRALSLVVLAATAYSSSSDASILNPNISLLTYTDFGQNLGRYSIGKNSALQKHLTANGVQISYTNPSINPYTLQHAMPDFSSQIDGGYAAAIGYNFIATVQHNGVANPTFSARTIGTANAIQYAGIEYRYSNDLHFLLTPETDYKITRLSKIITDVSSAPVYTDRALAGELIYRAGSGTMSIRDGDYNYTSLCGGYKYITGGIMSVYNSWGSTAANQLDAQGLPDDSGTFATPNSANWSTDKLSSSNPLIYVGDSGDSGSPSFIWNSATGRYEYAGALATGTYGYSSEFNTAGDWTVEHMNAYDVTPELNGRVSLRLGIADTQDSEVISGTAQADYNDSEQKLHFSSYLAKIKDENGNEIASFKAIQSGVNTWGSLNAVMNTDTWYAYGNEYLNASNASSSNKPISYAELMQTQNLVLQADGSSEYNIYLEGSIDTGIGYVRTDKGNQAHASFSISAEEGAMLNTAGFIVGEGTELHLFLSNASDYAREWRKSGEGDLYIHGEGNNYIGLNLGGSGTTYLLREDGYAAYNVLTNNGSTIVLKDCGQIARDFSFGNGGGTLDFNGNSMEWNNSKDASADSSRFSIHALTEDAVIANFNQVSSSIITWTESGTHDFLGSFQDMADGASTLRFIYNGGSGSRLTLHSIASQLNGAQSGLTVQSGCLELSGTQTLHGMGSLDGKSAERYSDPDDWHYADSQSNVLVQNGAVFQLGSHARLTGDVEVQSGGTYIMNEGVKHRFEYIEGGYVKEDTDAIQNYFGHKGNVKLAKDAQMKIAFSEGTDSHLRYAGNISGEGSLQITLGNTSAKLSLSGQNSFSGAKVLESGTLIAATSAALGNYSTEKWQIADNAVLACESWTANVRSADIQAAIDASSTGVLALTADRSEHLAGSNYYIGALEGTTVNYGAAGQTLAATDGAWRLGGGGGTLNVLSQLTGDGSLYIGPNTGTGLVNLSNSANDFTGEIILNGQVAVSGYLGNRLLSLAYGQGASASLSNISSDSAGMLLLSGDSAESLDLSSHQTLALAAIDKAIYSGQLIIADSAAYRLGGMGELQLQSQLAAGHDLIVDGQGREGSRVVLAKQESFNGSVSIQGGGIALAFIGDNALSQASSFSMSGSTQLDVSGSSQSIKNLNMDSQAAIVGNGSLSVQFSSSAKLYNLQAREISLIGNGGNSNNNYDLGGILASENLHLSQGYFNILSDSDSSALQLMDIGGNSNINVYSKSLDANILASSGESNYLNQKDTSSPLILHGSVDVSQGAKLEFGVANEFKLYHTELNQSGGNLSLRWGAGLYLEGTQTQSIGGKLIAGGVYGSAYTSQLYNNVSNVERQINELAMEGGKLNIHQDNASNSTWRIHSLTGSGNIYWLSGGKDRNRLVLDGAGNYNGTLEAQGCSSAGYGHHLELAHNAAAKNATINLNSNSADGSVALAVNTEMAELAGLKSGNDNAVIYAGSSANTSATAAPVSQGVAGLRISGNGYYEFKGSVLGDASNGINLTVANCQSMLFSGPSVNLQSVTVESGALYLDSKALAIYGDIELGSGSTLGSNHGLSLGNGQQLIINTEAGKYASLSSTLQLNGAGLVFNGDALSADSAALILSQSISGSDASVSISGSLASSGAGRYLLASGDWSGLQLSMGQSASYADCSLESTANGLYLNVSMDSNSYVWQGNASASSWDGSVFGSQNSSPNSEASVIFNDNAANKNVQLLANASVKTVNFENTEEYSLNGGDSLHSLSSSEGIILSGGGNVRVGNNIRLDGDIAINKGELILTQTNNLGGTVHGEGTLGLDWAGQSGSISLNSDKSLGTLHIINGQANANSTLNAKSIRVEGNGTLSSSSIQTAEIVLAGEAGSGANLILSNGAEMKGLLRLEDNSILRVDGSATLLRLNSGEHSLIKTGSGTLNLTSAAMSGNIDVREGQLYLHGYHYTNLESISLASGTSLQTNWGASVANGMKLNMASESHFIIKSGDNSRGLNMDISVQNGATIQGSLYDNSAVLSGSISGNGTLMLAQGKNDSGSPNDNTWTISSIISDGADGPLHLAVNSITTLTGNNSYSGGTTISALAETEGEAAQHILRAGSLHALGTGDVTMDGGHLSLLSDLEISALTGSTGDVQLNSASLIFTGNGEKEYSGGLANGGLIMNGNGTQSLNGSINVQSVSLLQGKLKMQNATVKGLIDSVGSGKLELSGSNTAGALRGTGSIQVHDSLVLNGNSDTIFNGSLQGKEVIYNGNASQSLNGTAHLEQLGVRSGVLELGSNATADNYIIGGQGTLRTDAGLQLNASQSLIIDSAASETAQLAGGLILNGGLLNFSSEMGSAQSPALQVSGSISKGELWNGQEVQLSGLNFSNSQCGHFTLALGDWSAFSSADMASWRLVGTQDFIGSFSANSQGLYIDLSYAAFVWQGTAGSYTWNATQFGTRDSAVSGTAHFNDSAANKTVNVSGNVHADAIEMDNSQKYLFKGEGIISADSVILCGSGETELGKNVELQSGNVDIQNGTLIVNANSSIANATISGSGTLQVQVLGDAAVKLDAEKGLNCLHLASGNMNLNSTALPVTTLSIDRSGTVSSSISRDFNVILNGNAGSFGNFSLSNGANLTGNVSLTADASIKIENSLSTVNKLNTGDNTLYKYGSGTLRLDSGEASGNIAVMEGQLAIKSSLSNLQSVSLAEGTSLLMDDMGKITNGMQLNMAGGSKFIIQNGAWWGGQLSNINILMKDDATIQGSLYNNDARLDGSIKGNGTLSLTQGYNADGTTPNDNLWTINATISDAEGEKLAIHANSITKLTGNNSYSGGTIISALAETEGKAAQHILSTGSLHALGTGDVTMDGGHLKLEADLEIRALLGESGDVQLNGHTMSFTTDGTADYQGKIAGGSLVMNGSGTQRLSGESSINSVEIKQGTLEILHNTSVSQSINAGGQTTISSSESGAAVQMDKGISLSVDSASKTTAISSLDTTQQARIEKTVMDLAEGTTLELSHVVLAASSKITDASATLKLDTVTVEMEESVNSRDVSASAAAIPAGTQLSMCNSAEQHITVQEGDRILYISSSAINDVLITGKSVTLDFSGFKAGASLDWLKQYDYVAVSFENGAVFDSNNAMDISATADGGYSLADGYYYNVDPEKSTAGGVIFSAAFMTPEPSSCTLSLLALAALAARRRRR